MNGGGYRFLTWSKGAPAIRKRATGRAEALTDAENAEQDLGTEDLIAIDVEDRPRLRVMLEVFFGVGERDGITAASAWLTERGIGWRWATTPAPPRRGRSRPAQRAPRPSRHGTSTTRGQCGSTCAT